MKKLPRKGYLAIAPSNLLVYEIVKNNRSKRQFTLAYPPFAEFPDFNVCYAVFESGEWQYERDRNKWSELLDKMVLKSKD